MGQGERCKLPQQSPGQIWILVHFGTSDITSERSASFWICGATSESGGKCPMPQRRTVPGHVCRRELYPDLIASKKVSAEPPAEKACNYLITTPPP